MSKSKLSIQQNKLLKYQFKMNDIDSHYAKVGDKTERILLHIAKPVVGYQLTYK